MEKILICLLSGIIVLIIVYEFLIRLEKLKNQQLVSEKAGKPDMPTNNNLTGIFLFISKLTGNCIGRLKIKYLSKYTVDIAGNLAVLGNNYSTIDPYTVIGTQVIAGFVSLIFTFILLATENTVVLTASFLTGFVLPVIFIREKVKEKRRLIFRQMPDVLDLLSIMIESGLDFNSAMNKIIESDKGVLVDELLKVQNQIRLGMPRINSFQDMASRINYAPLSTVVNSFTTAFKTGSSMAPTLKTLSIQFRTERAQMAEKIAGEAPVKLLAPLALLIFPTIFIILLGPIVLSFLGR